MSIEDKIDLYQDNYFMKIIGFTLGALIIGIVCFIDDIKGVPAVIKLAAQIISACVVIKFGIKIENLDIPLINLEGVGNWFYIILTIGWIVGITNAMNLIDGLDGLSTGISIISCLNFYR